MTCLRFLFSAFLGACVIPVVFAEEPIPKVTPFSQSLGTSHAHDEGFDPHRVFGSIGKYIAEADLIAIVEVSGTVYGGKTPALKGGAYDCKTTAKIIRVLKSNDAGEIVVFHRSLPAEHLFRDGPGEYLVFLKRTDGGYVATDGWPSSKPIRDASVIGWSDSHSLSVKSSLESSLSEIARQMKRHPAGK